MMSLESLQTLVPRASKVLGPAASFPSGTLVAGRSLLLSPHTSSFEGFYGTWDEPLTLPSLLLRSNLSITAGPTEKAATPHLHTKKTL